MAKVMIIVERRPDHMYRDGWRVTSGNAVLVEFMETKSVGITLSSPEQDAWRYANRLVQRGLAEIDRV